MSVADNEIRDIVVPLIEPMAELCKKPIGKFPSARAIAHAQVEQHKPLRFFVFSDGLAIVNPKILEASDPVIHKEGCYSFPFRDEKKVKRFNKIVVSYVGVAKNGVEEVVERDVITGINAFIFQHEIDHFNNKTIY